MGNEVKTILNKKYGVPLIQKGFNLIDIQPSNKGDGNIAFIFEKTEELEREFSIMLGESKLFKSLHGLTLCDIRTLCGVLQGYDIMDNDRFRIMGILTDIDNEICGYKKSVEDFNENICDEQTEINVEDLKRLCPVVRIIVNTMWFIIKQSKNNKGWFNV